MIEEPEGGGDQSMNTYITDPMPVEFTPIHGGDRPELEAVADVVREVIDNEGGCASGGWREGEVFLQLAAALDALDARRTRLHLME